MSLVPARPRSVAAIALALALPTGTPLHGQAPEIDAPRLTGDTILVTPRGRFPAGPLHRWVLGNGWRDLWATPFPAPVLDLETFAGGLTPFRIGGGQQTRSLRMQGADGVVYNFRSIDKNAARTLDPILRESLAADVLQDQVASLFPLSSMVVAPLLDAAGVFHPGPRLVVLPDRAAFEPEYADFAGLVGWLEVRPDEGADDAEGFEGSRRVVGTPRLFERLEEGSGDLVDQEAFLRARLMDFLVGDWDRHPDQWRWAGFVREYADREVTFFSPIPRDRDWALARLDGAFTAYSWIPWPQYMGFANEVPNVWRLSWNGRGLDRRYLNRLDRDAFLAVAADVRSALTDDVIEDAVGALPDSYRARAGDFLIAALTTRRDALDELAAAFYDELAGWVDVDLTDEDEEVEVDRHPDGSVRVRAWDLRGDERRAAPWFDRTFHPSETREVRLYLRGGDDAVFLSGAGPDDLLVRIVGGGGDDRVEGGDGSRGVRYYDDRGDNRVSGGVPFDDREWDEPEDAEAEQHGARPRDWGSRTVPIPVLSYAPSDGVIVGAGLQRTGYGFRHWPFHDRLRARIAVGLATGRVEGGVSLDVPVLGDALRNETAFDVRSSGARRFHGLGNGSLADADDDLFRAQRTEIELSSRFRISPTERLDVEFGATFEAIRPAEEDGRTRIEELQPYGWSDFEQIGVLAGVRWGDRPTLVRPRSGTAFRAEARLYPEAFDLVEGFSSVEAHLRHYVALDGGDRRAETGELGAPGLDPTLALRVGGRRVFGDYPFHHAAYVGGPESIRGFRRDRFAGDAMVYANTELRVRVGSVFLGLPADVGVIGLVDTGRVFTDPDRSDAAPGDAWHTGVGGGVWMQWVNFASASLTFARSDEDSGLYFRIGMPF